MRSLRLAAAFVAAVLLSPQTGPAGATPTPTFTISSPTAKAGEPEVFTITRASGGTGAYVLFQTGDGTAKAGTDYTAVRQLVYVKAGVQSVAVSVPTIANPAATGTLTFKAAIASTPAAAVGTASILELGSSSSPFSPGQTVTVVADEQSAPKMPDGMHLEGTWPTYSEALQRTVRAGETVTLAQESFPAHACSCAGQRRNWGVYGADGKFIGYLWEDNLR